MHLYISVFHSEMLYNMYTSYTGVRTDEKGEAKTLN